LYVNADIQIIAAIKGSEKYENLATGFRDVFNEINHYIANPRIQIEDEEYKLIFYLCSDYKVASYITITVKN